jgi:hypothetical protein
MKLLQEMRGFAEVTNRLPQPRQPGLFLMKLRSHFGPSAVPKRKRVIAIQMQERLDLPHPVKITHVKGNPLPVLRAP